MYTHSLNPYHLGAFRTYLVVIGDNNVPKENSLFKRNYIFILNCINIFDFFNLILYIQRYYFLNNTFVLLRRACRANTSTRFTEIN